MCRVRRCRGWACRCGRPCGWWRGAPRRGGPRDGVPTRTSRRRGVPGRRSRGREIRGWGSCRRREGRCGKGRRWWPWWVGSCRSARRYCSIPPASASSASTACGQLPPRQAHPPQQGPSVPMRTCCHDKGRAGGPPGGAYAKGKRPPAIGHVQAAGVGGVAGAWQGGVRRGGAHRGRDAGWIMKWGPRPSRWQPFGPSNDGHDSANLRARTTARLPSSGVLTDAHEHTAVCVRSVREALLASRTVRRLRGMRRRCPPARWSLLSGPTHAAPWKPCPQEAGQSARTGARPHAGSTVPGGGRTPTSLTHNNPAIRNTAP